MVAWLLQRVCLRRIGLIGLDAVLLVANFWLAFALRLWDPWSPSLVQNLHLLPWTLAIALPALFLSGWYQGLTRYSGSHSLYGIVPRTGVIVLLVLLVSTLSANPAPPFRGFWLLFWLLLSVSLVASRIVLRDLLRVLLRRAAEPSPRVTGDAAAEVSRLPTLVFGAGQAAHLLLSELRHHPRFQLVAVLDDDPGLWGRSLDGLPIRDPAELPDLIERHRIRQVLLAIPSATRARRRKLVEILGRQGLKVLSMPSLEQIATGQQAVSELRQVPIEDLIGRDPAAPDPLLLREAVAGKTVMVTGAGGSIGSELCRQILRQGPTRLVLLERNEFALYSIDQDLRQLAAGEPGMGAASAPVPLLVDVCDQPRLRSLLEQYGVQVLFHAAAYKHVPLVETNVCAGLSNNLMGTRAALEAAIACGLERFILISTDKAVRPTNAMGASKRACELLVQAAAVRLSAAGHGPICAMVRFGNVLGSSGSVVPLFRQQIASGGPLTVTHPEITRYFMTIPEAAQLVLQAAGLAQGGDVFLLDMGEPVRIVDLARQMIRLSGYRVRDEDHPDGDIAIRFTGLRPGEKLYEELLIGATDCPTAHPLIYRAREACVPADRLAQSIKRMEQALEVWDAEAVLAVLRQLVPEYEPALNSEPVSTEAQPRS